MHSSLVALLKKKYVYRDTLASITKRYDLSDEDVQEFKDVFPWTMRSFEGDDENNIKFFMQDICKHTALSQEEEAATFQRYLLWDTAAKDKLILHMTGYVISLAKRFTGLGLSLLDLVSEWMLWLNKAISMFDPEKAKRLSTYAKTWICNYMLAALADYNGATSLPLHTMTEIKKIEGIEQSLFQQFGRPPTQDEIIHSMQWSYFFGRNISKRRVIRLMQLKQWSVSLNHEIQDWADINTWDILEDTVTLTPAEESQKESLRKNVNYLINTMLSERDWTIIKMRFWIGWPKFTLEQIGQSLGITRERVRQIERRFILKVRQDPQLKVFLSV